PLLVSAANVAVRARGHGLAGVDRPSRRLKWPLSRLAGEVIALQYVIQQSMPRRVRLVKTPSGTRAHPVVFSPHCWQGCLGQICEDVGAEDFGGVAGVFGAGGIVCIGALVGGATPSLMTLISAVDTVLPEPEPI